MSANTTATAGAVRAAEACWYSDADFSVSDAEGVREYAAIIDRETGAADLLAALEACLPYVERAYECAFPDVTANESVEAQARAAIAKARGEA